MFADRLTDGFLTRLKLKDILLSGVRHIEMSFKEENEPQFLEEGHCLTPRGNGADGGAGRWTSSAVWVTDPVGHYRTVKQSFEEFLITPP